MGRHLDVNAHMQIAAAIALNIFDAFALNPKHCARLGARWNFNRSFTVQRGHADFGAERSLHKIYRDFTKQIVGLALKNIVGFDVENDIQIPRRTATPSGFAIAGGAKARTGIHAGGDAQLDFGGKFAAPSAAAGFARLLDDPPGALALRARLRDAEDATRTNNLAASAAGRARFGAGTGLCA